ncbi:hypothetical protein QFC19_003891 [Naganishia cerealis]|uniref:Uncharacterized protein n=1 Tax=Naganishia cerealis TaxID=610337 RepID=A0ACC2W095_9TREE|nr:hypothetical protein QFC19_003891 [Naganishia cerealis]
MSTAIVFGATGVSGIACLRALLQTPVSEYKSILAVSRRAPALDANDNRVKHVNVDLMGPVEIIADGLRKAGGADAAHVFFYSYIAKEEEEDLVETNRKLFSHSLEALAQVATKLQVLLLQTGYKYYGVHKGGEYLATYPFQESAPRHQGLNFYYVQEDMLKDAAKKGGYHWIVSRPNFILGESKGNFMSLAVTLGQYASLLKYLDKSLIFPGSSATYNLPYDFSTANHNAAHQLFLVKNEKAYDRAFNIHDGKPMRFSDLWPKVADYFGLSLDSPPAGDAPDPSKIGKEVVLLHSSAEFAQQNESAIDEYSKKHDLDPSASKYATWEFLDFATSRTWSDQGSLDAARSVGWTKDSDIWGQGFKPVFDAMREDKIIPRSA